MSDIKCLYFSPCIDPASPIANLSAEAPDPDFFFGYNSWWSGLPPIGSRWSSTGCISQCLSSVSQQDADICAARQQIACTVTDNSDGNGNNGWQDPGTGKQYTLFFNQAENCTVLCPDGLPFTFTEPAGRILAFSQLQANTIALQFACVNARVDRLCLSALTPTEACINQKYSGKIVATGATVSALNNIWLNPGAGLPPGIFMDFDIGGGTLTISGTPTVAGNYPFTIEIMTPTGEFMVKNYQLCVVDITPSSLPDATIGTAYSQQLKATSCANQTQSWQVVAGSLPAGLTLDEQTGIISGTPTGPAQSVLFRVRFQDQAS